MHDTEKRYFIFNLLPDEFIGSSLVLQLGNGEKTFPTQAMCDGTDICPATLYWFPVSPQCWLCHFGVFSRMPVGTPSSPAARWQWDCSLVGEVMESVLDCSPVGDVVHKIFDSEFRLPVCDEILSAALLRQLCLRLD